MRNYHHINITANPIIMKINLKNMTHFLFFTVNNNQYLINNNICMSNYF